MHWKISIFNSTTKKLFDARDCTSNYWRRDGREGFLFYTFASPLTLQILLGASDEAVHVGIVMRRGLAAMLFPTGLVILLVRRERHHPTKRVLFGCGICFAVISLSVKKIVINKAAVILLPATVL